MSSGFLAEMSLLEEFFLTIHHCEGVACLGNPRVHLAAVAAVINVILIILSGTATEIDFIVIPPSAVKARMLL